MDALGYAKDGWNVGPKWSLLRSDRLYLNFRTEKFNVGVTNVWSQPKKTGSARRALDNLASDFRWLSFPRSREISIGRQAAVKFCPETVADAPVKSMRTLSKSAIREGESQVATSRCLQIKSVGLWRSSEMVFLWSGSCGTDEGPIADEPG